MVHTPILVNAKLQIKADAPDLTSLLPLVPDDLIPHAAQVVLAVSEQASTKEENTKKRGHSGAFSPSNGFSTTVPAHPGTGASSVDGVLDLMDSDMFTVDSNLNSSRVPDCTREKQMRSDPNWQVFKRAAWLAAGRCSFDLGVLIWYCEK